MSEAVWEREETPSLPQGLLGPATKQESVTVTLWAVHGPLITQTCFKGQVSGSYTIDQESLGLEVWLSRVLWLAQQQPWVLSQHRDKGKKKKAV